MSITNTSYSVSQDVANSKPVAGSEDGSAGDTMDTWKEDRETILSTFSIGTYENNSSFTFPSGIISGNPGYQNAGDNSLSSEKQLGVSVSGKVLRSDGTPMSGTAILESGGDILTSLESNGQVLIVAEPEHGVTSGNDAKLVSYDFRYVPDIVAVSISSEGIGSGYDFGTIQYGGAKGKVIDYDGNPVKGVKVSGAGLSDGTGADGSWSMQVPGGTEVTISAIGTSKTYTIPAGGEIGDLDFQFSRLKVAVVDPLGNPLTGASVSINGVKYSTDENGEVVLRASIQEYDIDVDGVVEDSVGVDTEGSLYSSEYGNSLAGLRVTLKDPDSGEALIGVPLKFSVDGVASESGPDGKASVLVDSEGDNTVSIADTSRRYATARREYYVRKGDVVEDIIELSRRENIGTVV